MTKEKQVTFSYVFFAFSIILVKSSFAMLPVVSPEVATLDRSTSDLLKSLKEPKTPKDEVIKKLKAVQENLNVVLNTIIQAVKDPEKKLSESTINAIFGFPGGFYRRLFQTLEKDSRLDLVAEIYSSLLDSLAQFAGRLQELSPIEQPVLMKFFAPESPPEAVSNFYTRLAVRFIIALSLSLADKGQPLTPVQETIEKRFLRNLVLRALLTYLYQTVLSRALSPEVIKQLGNNKGLYFDRLKHYISDFQVLPLPVEELSKRLEAFLKLLQQDPFSQELKKNPNSLLAIAQEQLETVKQKLTPPEEPAPTSDLNQLLTSDDVPEKEKLQALQEAVRALIKQYIREVSQTVGRKRISRAVIQLNIPALKRALNSFEESVTIPTALQKLFKELIADIRTSIELLQQAGTGPTVQLPVEKPSTSRRPTQITAGRAEKGVISTDFIEKGLDLYNPKRYPLAENLAQAAYQDLQTARALILEQDFTKKLSKPSPVQAEYKPLTDQYLILSQQLEKLLTIEELQKFQESFSKLFEAQLSEEQRQQYTTWIGEKNYLPVLIKSKIAALEKPVAPIETSEEPKPKPEEPIPVPEPAPAGPVDSQLLLENLNAFTRDLQVLAGAIEAPAA